MIVERTAAGVTFGRSKQDCLMRLPFPSFSQSLANMDSQASVPRDVFPPTPPGPEGSNGNGLFRVQWSSGAWLLFCAVSRIDG